MPPITLSQSGPPKTVISAHQFKIQAQFEESILGTLLEAQGFHELIINDLPRGWETFLWEVEERLPATKKSYDPTRGRLRVTIMPGFIHNCAIEWLSDSKVEWVSSDAMTIAERRLVQLQGNTTLWFTDGPYSGTRKEPDALFHVPHQILPTLVVEVGWSESYEDLFDDMKRLLAGGDGKIKVAIIVNFIRHANFRASGVVELYRNDPEGIPKLAQNEVLFPTPADDPPQPLNIRRGELCAGQLDPGRNPADILPLFVRELRFHAVTCLMKEGYRPA